MREDISSKVKDTWERLSPCYENKRVREDSLDRLVDFPAQLKAIGDFDGKTILDLGCGSGEKTLYFAKNGAKRVVGLDISERFINSWKVKKKPDNLEFIQGSLRNINEISELSSCRFDLILAFQAVQYSDDLTLTFRGVRDHLEKDGCFTVSMAHPLRFGVERSEKLKMPIGAAYRCSGPYSYPSAWNKDIIIQHYTYTFSDMVTAFAENELYIEACFEPDLTPEQRQMYPHKAEWMEKYVGIIIFRARPI